MSASRWQLDMGAQAIEGGRVRFRVWAPAARGAEVEIYPWPHGIVRHPLAEEGEGVWSAAVDAGPGTLYRYRLDEHWAYPDPYSRSQPEGVHGPSQVVDPAAFPWTDAGWGGLDPEALVIYEVHVGAYTPEGTFDALIGQLDELRDLGVTALELMPVAEFPGRRNWGYDGVHLYAPSSVYGGPDALRRLVDAAHARGLGVILDVVYNHLGPEGNYLPAFSPHYFTDRYRTPWGRALNFDGEHSRRARHFFVQNARYWLHEYHIDGLRLDAAHHMYDGSPKHILQELSEAVHQQGMAGKRSLLFAEDERHELRIITPEDADGYGFDALWVDDFHHSVYVLLTRDRTYAQPYEGTAGEIARLLRAGFIHRSPPLKPGEEGLRAVAPSCLVYCVENHDQVGNRPHGQRLFNLVGLESFKAAAALLLLSPCVPLIFMGDEFAASTPFFYFSDYAEGLGEQIAAGRFDAFAWLRVEPDERRSVIPDPQAEETFLQSKLDLGERHQPRHDGVYALYRELLRLRREDSVLRRQDRGHLLAEAPAPGLVGVARWDGEGHRRLLLVNFGQAVAFDVGEQS
ncbi:MAG: malto-oligosyltrehalose trehalohydrolase, partial [Chloroflexi bacterium RBG_16_68_14]